MVCPKCGNEINKDWEVCGYCGYSLHNLPDQGIPSNPMDRPGKGRKTTNIVLFSSILIVLIGLFVIWQGFSLTNSSSLDTEISGTTKPSQPVESPPSIHTQNPETTEEKITSKSPSTEIATTTQMNIGSSIKLALPSNLTEITAQNAGLVREIALIGGGKFTVFQSDGSVLTEENIPLEGVSEVLLSPDGKLLILRDGSRKALLHLESLELKLLEEIDYRLYMFAPDSLGFLTRLSGSSKGDLLIYYDLRTDGIIPLPRSQIEREHMGFTDIALFSPDSKLFAASFDSETVHIWNIHDGELLLDMDMSKESTQRVDRLLFSPDSSLLAISTSGKEAAETVLINPRTGEVMFALEGSHGIHFFPSDNLLLSVARPGIQIRKVWDLNTSSLLGEIELYQEAEDKEALVNHPIFGLLTTENANALREFLNFPRTTEDQNDLPLSLHKSERDVLIKGAKPSQVFLSGHTDEVDLTTFILDHSLILSHASDGTVRLWGVYETQLARFLTGHEATVRQVAFSPDGNILASMDIEGMLWLWDIKTHSPIGNWQILLKSSDFDPHAITFSRDGSKLMIAPPMSREIYIWDIKSQEKIFSMVSDDLLVFDALFFPNGEFIAVSEMNTTSRNLEWIIYRVVDELKVNQFEGNLSILHGLLPVVNAISPDGFYLAEFVFEDQNQGKINIYDVNNGALVTNIPINSFGGVLSSPDGKLLTNGISAWETGSWELETQIAENAGGIMLPIRFSEDGEFLAIFQLHPRDSSNEAKKTEFVIFQMQDSKVMYQIELEMSFTSEVYLPSIDISPDMKMIAAPYGDRIILTEFSWDR